MEKGTLPIITLLLILVGTQADQLPVPVLFDHDGGVDDFITLLLLLSNQQKVQLIGVTIVDGDCHVDVAANTTLKILTLLDRRDVPVAVSSLQAANPFPAPYRSQGLILDVLPVLNQKPSDVADLRHRQLQKQSGQEYFAQLLLQQQQKVTIVATGPLTNLAYALDKYSQVADKVQHVWWMGGALRVPGNVYEPNTDGSAEWNAYCDPQAMGVVWNSSVPLTLVPLDGTNKVPITPDLVYSFGPQAHHLYSLLAGTMYAPVINWVYSTPGEPYYAWDALTAACMMDPDLCKVTHGLEVAAVLSGPAQGATVLSPQAMQAYEAQQSAAAATAHTPALEHGHHQGSTHQGWGQEMSGMHSDPHVERVLLGDSASSDKISSSTGEGKVHTVKGSEVSQQLSAFKVVSAVMDVDAQQEFHDSLLASFRQ